MSIRLSAVFESPDMADMAVSRLRSGGVIFEAASMRRLRVNQPVLQSGEVNILYPYPAAHPTAEAYSLNGQNTTLSMRAMLSSGWGVRPYPRDGEAVLTVTLDRCQLPHARSILVGAHARELRVTG